MGLIYKDKNFYLERLYPPCIEQLQNMFGLFYGCFLYVSGYYIDDDGSDYQ